MLRRLAPSFYEGTTGEVIRIAAISQNNSGVEAARFRYGPMNLAPRAVGGHPGCEFVVDDDVTTFRAVVAFAPGAAGARYDLCQEDQTGNLVPLDITVRAQFGPITQFQVDGVVHAFAMGGVAGIAAGAVVGPVVKRTPRRAKKKKNAKKKKTRTAKNKAPAPAGRRRRRG